MTGFHGRPEQYDHTGLVTGLRTAARGFCDEFAAVESLIAHRFWLTRADFRDRFVRTGATPREANEPPAAWVNWIGAATALKLGWLECSSDEAALLHIAIALATSGPFPTAALSSLDRDSLVKVLTATAHADGYSDVRVEIR
ncbi:MULTISPECIES: hypothetical protein [Actinomadura]|uniref:Uncharacterized protein n=1 Tax=Actinomadura yumaensis TaxID=111807 RepID=A0ABW2CDL9_9ACTN|nr:hypothetical protein [Actinomadura sp. J1-007]MWK35665.1 hypothetical protein [Actinomadura sp. J1-007]